MWCHPDRLKKPLSWRKPRRVFVASMSDPFHDAVPDDFLDRVFAVMALSPQHTFQLLTKRPERMRDYMASKGQNSGVAARIAEQMQMITSDPPSSVKIYPMGPEGEFGDRWFIHPWPLPNVWLGVSVEDQKTADQRIPILMGTPASVRFLSAEPLLGPVDLWGSRYDNPNGGKTGAVTNWGGGVGWVVVGGESGRNARACNVAWIRSIVEQCKAADVSVFVKQLGASPVEVSACGPDESQGTSAALASIGGASTTQMQSMLQTGWTRVSCPDGTSHYARYWSLEDKKGGDPSEWPEDLRVREFPSVIGEVKE